MRSLKLAAMALAISPMLLGGCGMEVFEAGCLTVRPYSPIEQEAVAAELETLGPHSATGQFMADYGRLRDEARALCR